MQIQTAVKKIVLASCFAVALQQLSGCAFSQWTEHYYFGNYVHKPVYPNRIATGVAIMPFALVGDLVTLPVQAVLVIFKGDDFLYKKSSVGSKEYFSNREVRSDSALANLSPSQHERVETEVATRLDGLDGSSRRVAALGVFADGRVEEVALSAEALDQLKQRVELRQIHPASACPL